MSDVNDRRLMWPEPERGKQWVFTLPIAKTPETMKLRRLVLQWCEKSTVGEFYIGGNVIVFYNDQDAMMYQLSDPQKNCEAMIG